MAEKKKKQGQFFWAVKYKILVGPDERWWFEMHLHGICLFDSRHEELYGDDEPMIMVFAHAHHCGRASALGLRPGALPAEWTRDDRRDVPSLIMPDGSRKICEPS